jgi:hypothetical protein
MSDESPATTAKPNEGREGQLDECRPFGGIFVGPVGLQRWPA